MFVNFWLTLYINWASYTDSDAWSLIFCFVTCSHSRSGPLPWRWVPVPGGRFLHTRWVGVWRPSRLRGWIGWTQHMPSCHLQGKLLPVHQQNVHTNELVVRRWKRLSGLKWWTELSHPSLQLSQRTVVVPDWPGVHWPRKGVQRPKRLSRWSRWVTNLQWVFPHSFHLMPH